MRDEGNYRYDEQQMNRPAGDVEGGPRDQPGNEQNKEKNNKDEVPDQSHISAPAGSSAFTAPEFTPEGASRH
jgi:hypothetical protein